MRSPFGASGKFPAFGLGGPRQAPERNVRILSNLTYSLQFLDVRALLSQLELYFASVVAVSRRHCADPILINGVDLQDGSPITWINADSRGYVMSSLTRQLHLFKSIDLCAELTGDHQYWQVHEGVLRHYLTQQVRPDGLLNWGGHIFVDATSGRVAGPINKGLEHELKDTFPDYEAMHRLEPAATLRFIESFWARHAVESNELVVSRHGSLAPLSEPFRFEDIQPSSGDHDLHSERLTFINAANDLIYAALKYFDFTSDTAALQAAMKLLRRYVARRDPRTGLGCYMYTIPKIRAHTNDDTNTMSWFGDRAARQLGPELGERALEMNLLLERHVVSVYGENPLMLFACYLDQGEAVRPLCEFAAEGLEAFVREIYNSANGRCRPVLIDGTDLTAFELKRDGYYGRRGEQFRTYPLPTKVAAAVILASLIFPSPVLKKAASSMFAGFGLGTLKGGHEDPQVNLATACADPHLALCLVNAFRVTGNRRYMSLAECVVDKMLRVSWYEPYYRTSIASRFACFDAIEPYVLTYFLSVADGRNPCLSLSSSAAVYGDYRLPVKGVVNLVDSEHFRHAVVDQWR